MGTLPEIMGQASVALGIGMYIKTMLPNTDTRIVAVVIAVVFYLCNIRGVSVIAGVQKYMVYILFAGLGIFTVVSLKGLNPEAVNFAGNEFMTHGWKGFRRLDFSTTSPFRSAANTSAASFPISWFAVISDRSV